MRRFVLLLGLPLLAVVVGCTNRPLAQTLDCIFPSKAQRRPEPPPDGLFRPADRDRDPLPPPVFDPNPRTPPRDTLPRIGDPVAPDGRPTGGEGPLPREPSSGAMPLPGGR